MILVFLGAPGSGKGTIASMFCKYNNYKHISTGQLIRNSISSKTQLGLEMKENISKGLFVADDIVLKILKEELNKIDSENIILDGIPRNISQAEALSNIIKIDKAVYIDVAYDIVIKRLTGRRICPKCQKVFNFSTDKKVSCDVCGETLIQRDDDKIEIIEKRLDIFEKETLPLVKYYENLDKLIKIESVDSTQAYHDIVKSLEF